MHFKYVTDSFLHIVNFAMFLLILSSGTFWYILNFAVILSLLIETKIFDLYIITVRKKSTYLLNPTGGMRQRATF